MDSASLAVESGRKGEGEKKENGGRGERGV